MRPSRRGPRSTSAIDQARNQRVELADEGWRELAQLGRLKPIAEDGGASRRAYMDVITRHATGETARAHARESPEVAGFVSVGALAGGMVDAATQSGDQPLAAAPTRPTQRRQGSAQQQQRDVTCTRCHTRETVIVSREKRLRYQRCTCGGRWRETRLLDRGPAPVDKTELAADVATLAQAVMQVLRKRTDWEPYDEALYEGAEAAYRRWSRYTATTPQAANKSRGSAPA